jgi:peptidoglycan/LPS O-acetylase OafA/YrhL
VTPKLLTQRTTGGQVLLALVAPAGYGAFTGVMLGVSSGVYTVLLFLAIIGGYIAGYEQRGGGEGFGRGLAGGMLFGTFILLGHEIAGTDEKTDLPDPHVLLPVMTTAAGALVGALGGAMRERRERSLNPPERIGETDAA